jgi:hypothetical protein
VSAFTDEHGMATFRIVGAARNLTGGDPGAGFRCARIYADGVLIAYVNIGAYDEDGSGGVNPADLSVWMVDFFEGVYLGRSDFNCSQHINPADLALLLNVALHEGSRTSPQSYCH